MRDGLQQAARRDSASCCAGHLRQRPGPLQWLGGLRDQADDALYPGLATDGKTIVREHMLGIGERL